LILRSARRSSFSSPRIFGFFQKGTDSRGWRFALLVAFVLLSGCATYSERVADVRTESSKGAYDSALQKINGALGVRSIEDMPKNWKGDRPLAVLERSILLQATEEYAFSARDMSGAETELELLDLKTDTVGQIGKYVYSDSSQDYEASATERLALNGLNVANYLALGNLSGAAVEARRFTNMRDYLSSVGLDAHGTFGAYLSGFVFEKLGEGDRALRFYEEALEQGQLASLAEPVGRLARGNPYRGAALNELLSRPAAQAGTGSGAPAEILTIFALGRVPYKVPKRIPIGAAVGIAGTWITGNPAILERSVFKVVVYPELEASNTRAGKANLKIDGKSVQVEQVSAIGVDIRKEYELIKPRIIGAALTRMIARAAVAEGVRAAGKQAGPVIGLLAALAAEGSMVALDKPDTRSWTLLPNQISIARTPVEPGSHTIDVVIPGVSETRSMKVDVPANGYTVVLVTVPR
jgi:hypothetical protein